MRAERKKMFQNPVMTFPRADHGRKNMNNGIKTMSPEPGNRNKIHYYFPIRSELNQ